MTVPSFTVLEDQFRFDQPREPIQPTWESQYASNIIPAPQNNPFAQYDLPYNDPSIDYENTSPPSRIPRMAPMYDETLHQDYETGKHLQQWGLSPDAPGRLRPRINLPTEVAPYGNAYPTNGYSAFDGEVAMGSNIQKAYGLPGVPIASWPALEDARNSPSVPMGPNHLYMVAEKHFKEGYKSAREDYERDYKPTCTDAMSHAKGCSICHGYLHGDKKFLWFVIGVLVVIIFILLWVLYKKFHRHNHDRGHRARSASGEPNK